MQRFLKSQLQHRPKYTLGSSMKEPKEDKHSSKKKHKKEKHRKKKKQKRKERSSSPSSNGSDSDGMQCAGSALSQLERERAAVQAARYILATQPGVRRSFREVSEGELAFITRTSKSSC